MRGMDAFRSHRWGLLSRLGWLLSHCVPVIPAHAAPSSPPCVPHEHGSSETESPRREVRAGETRQCLVSSWGHSVCIL